MTPSGNNGNRKKAERPGSASPIPIGPLPLHRRLMWNGAALARARQKQGWTQAELGNYAGGVSRGTVAIWECNARWPGVRGFALILGALGAGPLDFWTEEKEWKEESQEGREPSRLSC